MGGGTYEQLVDHITKELKATTMKEIYSYVTEEVPIDVIKRNLQIYGATRQKVDEKGKLEYKYEVRVKPGTLFKEPIKERIPILDPIEYDFTGMSDEDIRRAAISAGIQVERIVPTDKYTEEIKKGLTKIFHEKAEFNWAGKKQSENRRNTQTENFQKMFDKVMVDRPATIKFRTNKNKERVIDLTPLWTKFRQEFRKELKAKEVTPFREALREAIDVAKMPKPDEVTSPIKGVKYFKKDIGGTRLYREYMKALDRAEKGGFGSEAMAVRDAINSQMKLPKKDRVIESSYELNILRAKADKIVENYNELYLQPNTFKPLDLLKRTLALKGVDVTKVKSLSRAQTLAKKHGIGLKMKDLDRTDYLAILKKVSRQIDVTRFDKLSNKELKNKYEAVKAVAIRPRETSIVRYEDIPTHRSVIKSQYKELFNKELKDKVFTEKEKEVRNSARWLSPDEVSNEASRRVAVDLLVTQQNAVSAYDELINRFKHNYDKITGAPGPIPEGRDLTPKELTELSGLSTEKFRRYLASEPVPIIDPKTKKPRISLVTGQPLTTKGNFIPQRFWTGEKRKIRGEDLTPITIKEFKNKLNDAEAKGRDSFTLKDMTFDVKTWKPKLPKIPKTAKYIPQIGKGGEPYYSEKPAKMVFKEKAEDLQPAVDRFKKNTLAKRFIVTENEQWKLKNKQWKLDEAKLKRITMDEIMDFIDLDVGSDVPDEFKPIIKKDIAKNLGTLKVLPKPIPPTPPAVDEIDIDEGLRLIEEEEANKKKK